MNFTILMVIVEVSRFILRWQFLTTFEKFILIFLFLLKDFKFITFFIFRLLGFYLRMFDLRIQQLHGYRFPLMHAVRWKLLLANQCNLSLKHPISNYLHFLCSRLPTSRLSIHQWPCFRSLQILWWKLCLLQLEFWVWAVSSCRYEPGLGKLFRHLQG